VSRPEAKPTVTVNADGPSPFVIVCDHASNRIPEHYGDMGLTQAERESHIAWDPGAMAVSEAMVAILDCPLVASTVSRLVIDCNRDIDAPDLIWQVSETTRIAANENVSAEEREYRIAAFHAPFHAAIDAVLDARAGRETVLVCMHSFTPVYHGIARPWPIGLIHGADVRFTQHVRDALVAETPELNVGWNEPYAALNGVTLTLERHGDGRGLNATMIEIRNDEIADAAGVALWAERLSRALVAAREAMVAGEGGGRDYA
jgi:predicted N-formylglutamate amidohydrolase